MNPPQSRPWEWDNPLGPISEPDHSPRESRAALQALNDYAQMGQGRSLDRLAEQYRGYIGSGLGRPPTRHRPTLGKWSVDHHWQDRIARWEVLQLEAERAEWEQRRRELRREEWEVGERMLDLARQGLAQGENFVRTSRRVIQGSNGEPDREIITLKLDARSLREFAESGIGMQREAAEMDRQATGTEDDPIHHVAMSLDEWQAQRQQRLAQAEETLAHLIPEPGQAEEAGQ